jgi:hypothetical protein
MTLIQSKTYQFIPLLTPVSSGEILSLKWHKIINEFLVDHLLTKTYQTILLGAAFTHVRKFVDCNTLWHFQEKRSDK